MAETGLTGSEIIESNYEISQSVPERLDPELPWAVSAPEFVFDEPVAGQRTRAEQFHRGIAGFLTTLGHPKILSLHITD